MGAVFDQVAPIKHSDFITKTAGGQPVRDEDGAALAGDILEAGVDFMLSDRIQRGGRLVQHKEGGLLIKGAGQGDELGFAAGRLDPLRIIAFV